MKCHEPGPPLLFTMIMKAIVMPRTTSSDRNRWMGTGAREGLVMRVSMSRSSMNPTLPVRGLLRQVLVDDAGCSGGFVWAGEDLSLIHISEPTRQAEISYAVF